MKMISSEYAGKVVKERKSSCAVCRKSVGSDAIFCQSSKCGM